MATLEREIRTINLHDGEMTQTLDELALDEPICIFVNDEYLVTLIATPNQIRELAIGYLLCDSIIKTPNDINGIRIRENNVYVELNQGVDLRSHSIGRMNLIVTACGANPQARTNRVKVPKITSDLTVDPQSILGMMRELNKKCSVHLRTRGTHSAMICGIEGQVQAFAEDVGRHNAVDKVIGVLAIKGVDPSGCVLLSTGRHSGEIILKAAQAGIPVVASMTVPLVSGLRLAEESGITLISLGRGTLKIYTHSERVIGSS